MTRKPPYKVPDWFWKEKESNVINFIINHKESNICCDILMNNKVIYLSAAMLNEGEGMVTIIYEDKDSLKNDYTRSIFNLSDYLNFYKIEHRKKKINKIKKNLI